MKKLIAVLLALMAGSAFAGQVCSRFDGPGLRSCNTAAQFKVDPVPGATDDGLGAAGNSAE